MIILLTDPVEPRILSSNRNIKTYETKKKQTLIVGDNLDVLVGTTVSITCPVVGNPQPTIKWTKSGADILVSRFVKIKNNTLTIFGGRWSDTGPYTCIATNAAGSDSKSTFVNFVRKYNRYLIQLSLGTLSNEDGNANDGGSEKTHFWLALYFFERVIRVLFFCFKLCE